MCLSHRDEQMQQKLTDAGDLDKELQREREKRAVGRPTGRTTSKGPKKAGEGAERPAKE